MPATCRCHSRPLHSSCESAAPEATLSALRNVARDLDSDLPISRAQTMDERIRRTVNLRRAVVSLLGVLGGLTLVLTSVGIYGVAAHSVSMRTRKLAFGCRWGARLRRAQDDHPGEPLALVDWRRRWSRDQHRRLEDLASQLFGVTSTDAVTFTGGAAILCFVSLGASYLPHAAPLASIRFWRCAASSPHAVATIRSSSQEQAAHERFRQLMLLPKDEAGSLPGAEAVGLVVSLFSSRQWARRVLALDHIGRVCQQTRSVQLSRTRAGRSRERVVLSRGLAHRHCAWSNARHLMALGLGSAR